MVTPSIADVTTHAQPGPRFNALKHGRYAASTLLPGDDPLQYQRERRALFHNYRPQTKDEADLVAMMAESRWGLQRYYPLQHALDDQALSPETDAAGRVAEPIAHQRLHSGMDVTVQRQRLARMWHRARAGLAEAQQMRLRGLVAGALKLPKDCYVETDALRHMPCAGSGTWGELPGRSGTARPVRGSWGPGRAARDHVMVCAIAVRLSGIPLAPRNGRAPCRHVAEGLQGTTIGCELRRRRDRRW